MVLSRTARMATDRLELVPLSTGDAREMVGVLSSNLLYTFTGGSAPTLSELERRYAEQCAGPAAQNEAWHNWIVRWAESGAAVGFVQATVVDASADVAWVVSPGWQGRGLATEAAKAMCGWLVEQGVTNITAHIHPNHLASARVADRVGLVDTAEVDGDGEIVWAFEVA